ncbi:hypothetical protein AVEN_155546-1, partial [Araneus ventricosus]
TQALAVLALTCAAKQHHEVFYLDEIKELTMELKKRQYRNGTVENLKTTALVLQALFASESEADEENFDEANALKQILRSQKENGFFGNVANTYYALPVLLCRSLVNISSSHCKSPVIDEKEALKDLMNQVGEKWSIQFSLWVGNSRTVERTLTLNVPANSSFYRIMEFAAGVDNRFKFEYSMRKGKPYIYSISEIQDDPENGMFWFLFKPSSSDEGDLELITKSPAEVVPSNKQHLIFCKNTVYTKAKEFFEKRKFKLPKIELKKFTGDAKEYLSFWSQFRKIHEDISIPNEDKMQYLLQAVVAKTKAARVVESFSDTAENNPKAIAHLKERFGRDDLLVKI